MLEGARKMHIRPDDDTLGRGSSYMEYRPSPEQIERLNLLMRLVTRLEGSGVRYSIPGGYGLDGLYGRLTRDHEDIDMLVTREEAEAVRKMLRAASFELDIVKIRGDVEVFRHRGTETKLELAFVDRLDAYSEMSHDEFLPLASNAVLQKTHFRTPTIVGHGELARIQMHRAQEGQWGPYAHSDWKHWILGELKR